jgi:enoyl-CoA hydratase
MNSADKAMHAELGQIWDDLDRDPSVNAVIITGAGKTFSAGGDFQMIEDMIVNFDDRARAWTESRDLVYGVINCS